ncbi:hypothetical protein DPMN_185733 [Dreissena polymorpha]|uniref:Uncharacterized protein n=1 Tax=Dreissena polymorpha TaxID=45954 RepID=A0A9D4DKY5_DREPO|nr:hypothetical protein DPMN_185733 [Dreissena polymorpha]
MSTLSAAFLVEMGRFSTDQTFLKPTGEPPVSGLTSKSTSCPCCRMSVALSVDMVNFIFLLSTLSLRNSPSSQRVLSAPSSIKAYRSDKPYRWMLLQLQELIPDNS